MSLLDRLRSTQLPLPMDSYFGGDFEYENFDSEPKTILDKAVSSLLHSHYSIREEFLELVDAKNPIPEDNEVSHLQEIDARVKKVHAIYQTASNMSAEAAMLREKLVFGIGGKVYFESEGKVQATHIKVEDLALGSSNGLNHDIFGYRLYLNEFQATQMFPRYSMYKESQHFSPTLESEYESSEGDWFYTIQMPKDVFKRHVEGVSYKHTNSLKEGKKYSSMLSPNEEVVEISFTDTFKVLDIKGMNTRSIVVSNLYPPSEKAGISKGLGESNQGLIIATAEVIETNLSGYERTYAPAWFLPSSASTYGLELTANGIIYGQNSRNKPPEPLSLNANVDGMLRFNEYLMGKLEKGFFLDAFNLANNYNMTKKEVDLRQSDGLANLAMFLIEDENSNLVPSCRYLNSVIDQYEGEILDGKMLSPRFISPIATSLKEGFLTKMEKVFLAQVNAGKSMEANPVFKNMFDNIAFTKRTFANYNSEQLLRDNETMDKAQQKEDHNQYLDKQQKTEQLINAQQANINALEGVNAGVPPQGQTPAA